MVVATDTLSSDTRTAWGRLAQGVELMRELSRHTDPETLHHVFMRRLQQSFPASRRLCVARHGTAGQVRVLRYNLWSQSLNPETESQRLPVLESLLLARLAAAEEPMIVDALALQDDDPASHYLSHQQSLVAVPIYDHGVVAATWVLAREQPEAFSVEESSQLVWLLNLFTRAYRALVHSHDMKDAYQHADYELRVIAELQQSLLPADVPSVSGLDVATHYRTAHRAGGDLYDFFELPGDRLGVLIADVSGHGSPAAVLMAITHSLAHSFPDAPLEPGRFLGHLNKHLARRYVGTTGNFVTAFYAVFDPAARQMTYASAGHPAPRVRRRERPDWNPLAVQQSLPLGINSTQERYPVGVAPFAPGDRVVLYTDGLTDALNRSGDPFGERGLDGPGSVAHDAEGEIRRMLADLNRFTDGVPVADDRTIVVVSGVEVATMQKPLPRLESIHP